jgi:predicted regulator of amino acid metabolism with ACT domain
MDTEVFYVDIEGKKIPPKTLELAANEGRFKFTFRMKVKDVLTGQGIEVSNTGNPEYEAWMERNANELQSQIGGEVNELLEFIERVLEDYPLSKLARNLKPGPTIEEAQTKL